MVSCLLRIIIAMDTQDLVHSYHTPFANKIKEIKSNLCIFHGKYLLRWSQKN